MMADAEKLTGMRTPFEVLAGATLTLRIELQIDGQETAVGCASSISKEFLESLRRQGGIPRRILDIAMAEIRLDRARIVTIVGELVAAGVPQHVGVRLDAQVGHDG